MECLHGSKVAHLTKCLGFFNCGDACLLESVLNYWQPTCREQRWKLKYEFLSSLKKNKDISVSACGERTDTLFWSLHGKVCMRAKWPIRPELIPVSVA